MKEKIFDKMIKYGWNLGDNEFKDFNEVYELHYNFLDSLYDKFSEANDYIEEREVLESTDSTDLYNAIAFIGDFLRAINDLESEKKYGK